MKTGQHIVVAGSGNTGAFVALLLARMPGVARLILVDPDTYTESNIMAQNIYSRILASLRCWPKPQNSGASIPGRGGRHASAY